jgi:glycosyltransferase involved in cell wall biosynthesis
VAADVGAVRDVLGDGERGVVVPPGDLNATTEALRDLAANPSRAQNMADRALEWVARHTAEAQASEFVTWLRESFPKLAWER